MTGKSLEVRDTHTDVLRKRVRAWKEYVGRDSVLGRVAPHVISKLQMELKRRERPAPPDRET